MARHKWLGTVHLHACSGRGLLCTAQAWGSQQRRCARCVPANRGPSYCTKTCLRPISFFCSLRAPRSMYCQGPEQAHVLNYASRGAPSIMTALRSMSAWVALPPVAEWRCSGAEARRARAAASASVTLSRLQMAPQHRAARFCSITGRAPMLAWSTTPAGSCMCSACLVQPRAHLHRTLACPRPALGLHATVRQVTGLSVPPAHAHCVPGTHMHPFHRRAAASPSPSPGTTRGASRHESLETAWPPSSGSGQRSRVAEQWCAVDLHRVQWTRRRTAERL